MPTHYRGSRETVRALNAHINLIRASDSLIARLNGGIEKHGLTMGQFGVLESLLYLGPMCQRTLGEKLLRSGGNITLIVDNLERQALVRRERQKDDRRMIVIHLTPLGRRLIERLFPEHAKMIAKEMGELTPREQETLRRICRKLGCGNQRSGFEKARKKEENHVADSTE